MIGIKHWLVGSLLFISMCLATPEANGQRGLEHEQNNVRDEQQAARSIGSRLELFVDDWLIDRMKGVRLKLHRPVRRDVSLRIDQPWEKIWRESPDLDPTPFGYSTVIKDDDVFRMYYSWDRPGDRLTGYAESRDGVRWQKPKLGLVEFRGSKANNLVWAAPRHYDFTPFRDLNPKAKPDQQYKMLVGGPLHALVSADGLHWKYLTKEPVIRDGAFDSQNTAFWDTQLKRYVAYYRDFVKTPKGQRVRAIKRATSHDFVNWTPGKLLDYGHAPLEQFYTNGIVPYFRAPHIYVGFPMRFVPDRKAVAEHPHRGVSDVVFMSSRDGLHWDRRFREAAIRPGRERKNWTERNYLMVWGIVPTGPSELSIYWVEHYRHPTNRIRRGTLRTDGFTSLHAGYHGGEVLTKPLVFKGQRLALNYSTSAVGSIRVEILNSSGKPIAGFSGNDAPELFGDTVAGEYRWTSKAELGKLAGRPVRIRIFMKDADLFSIQFQP